MFEYGLKFMKLFHYATEMVKVMRSRMSLLVVGLGCLSSKEGRATILLETWTFEVDGLCAECRERVDKILRRVQ